MVQILKVTQLVFHKDIFALIFFHLRKKKKGDIQFQHQKGKQLPPDHNPVGKTT